MNGSNDDRHGFSLLEVIIATAILASSTILLLSLFATGERHAARAETRVIGQMLCQTMLDAMLADPSQLAKITDDPYPNYAGWTYSVDWTPTDIDGLVRLSVSVKEVVPGAWTDRPRADRGFADGADLPGNRSGESIIAESHSSSAESVIPSSVNRDRVGAETDRPTFALTRWARLEPRDDLASQRGSDAPSATGSSTSDPSSASEPPP